jgi:hypothetical protein
MSNRPAKIPVSFSDFGPCQLVLEGDVYILVPDTLWVERQPPYKEDDKGFPITRELVANDGSQAPLERYEMWKKGYPLGYIHAHHSYGDIENYPPDLQEAIDTLVVESHTTRGNIIHDGDNTWTPGHLPFGASLKRSLQMERIRAWYAENNRPGPFLSSVKVGDRIIGEDDE